MMFDHSCSLNTIIAWTAWILAAVGAVLYALVTQRVGIFAVLFAAMGATLHVRGFIHALDDRQRRAFELGRESVRSIR